MLQGPEANRCDCRKIIDICSQTRHSLASVLCGMPAQGCVAHVYPRVLRFQPAGQTILCSQGAQAATPRWVVGSQLRTLKQKLPGIVVFARALYSPDGRSCVARASRSPACGARRSSSYVSATKLIGRLRQCQYPAGLGIAFSQMAQRHYLSWSNEALGCAHGRAQARSIVSTQRRRALAQQPAGQVMPDVAFATDGQTIAAALKSEPRL